MKSTSQTKNNFTLFNQEDLSNDFLDLIIPLDFEKHRNVVSYQLDYSHLLAYFNDGRHTGLKDQSSFIGYKGYKESPNTLFFKNKYGTYLEIILERKDLSNKNKKIKIKEINILKELKEYTKK
jgi:malate synthase